MNAITELTKKLTDGDAELFEFYWRGLLQSPSRLIDACRSVFDVREGHSIATCMTMFEDASSLQLLKGFYANKDGPFAQYTSELDIDSGASPGCCSIRSRMLRLLRGTSLAIAVADEDFSEVQRCVASMLPNLLTTSEPQWDTSSDPARAVDAWLQNAACAQGVDLSLERDVLNQFCGGFRPARQTVKLPVLYYNGDVGYRCTLSCDAIVRGTGNVFPDPQSMTLAPLCGDFVRSVHDSWNLACRLFNSVTPIEIDVRWSLDLSALPHTNRMPLPVMGKSMGATLATVFWQLLAGEEVDNHWALTAAVNDTGKLSSVGGVEAKAKEWFQFDKHICQLMVTEKDASDAKAGARAANVGEPDRHVHIVRTIQEVASTLTELERQRYGTTRRRPPLDVRFTGRSKIFNRVQSFIEDCESRYLVLTGGMGRGKTQLMSKLIHEAFNSGDRPVYYMISQNQPVTEVGQSLSQQLRRKYAHDLPNLRNDLRLTPLLEEINAWLIKRNRTEVLYIDAADQLAGESRRGGLLPEVLPAELPSQFRCVVTSRYDQQWYRQTRGVLFENLDAHTDDRQDVRTYLMRYGQELEPPLSQKLIDAIVSSTHRAPVFFTVRKCLEQCGDDALLRQDAELWLREPEVLIGIAADKLEDDAEKAKLENSQVWETLAIVALAGEPLSEDQFDDLELWEPDVTDKVLKLAASFFRPVHSSSKPIEFDHPGYERVVLAKERLKKSQRKKVLTQLLEACRNWHDLDEARGYALRQLPRLLTEFEEWSELVELFRDLEYLEARTELGGTAIETLIADFHTVITKLPDDSVSGWQMCLLCEAIERSSHVLTTDPSLFFQCMWNLCWWYDCDDRGNHRTVPRIDDDNPLSKQELLCELLSRWQLEKMENSKSLYRWTRKLRPPAVPLGSGPKYVLHDCGAECVVWNPTGDQIAIGNWAGTTRILGFPERKELARYQSPKPNVREGVDSRGFTAINSISWNHDGTRLAIGGSDFTTRILATPELTLLTTLWCGNQVECVAFSPNGQRLATAVYDRVGIWNANDARLLSVIDCGQSTERISWSADGTRLATAGSNGTRIWNVTTANPQCVIERQQKANSVSWSPSGNLVAFGGCDGVVQVINVEHDKEIAIYKAHQGSTYGIAWSQDCSRIASSGWDGRTQIMAVANWELLSAFESLDEWGISDIAWRPNGEELLTVGKSKLEVWDLSSVDNNVKPVGHRERVRQVTICPDSKRLVTASDNVIKTWDTGTYSEQTVVEGSFAAPHGLRLATINCDTGQIYGTGKVPIELDANVRFNSEFLTWSNDGAQLAGVGIDNTIRIWGTSSGNELHVLHGHAESAGFSSLKWNPKDSSRLASGCRDGTARIWDSLTGRQLVILDHMPSDARVLDISWNNDGSRLATASDDGKIRIWDATSGGLIFSLSGHASDATCVCWSPTSHLVASGDSRGTVRVWAGDQGDPLLVLEGHQSTVWRTIWSPDGNLIASASEDHTVRVWDAFSGKQLNVIEEYNARESGVCWLDNGRHLVTTMSDTFQISDLKPNGQEIRSLLEISEPRRVN